MTATYVEPVVRPPTEGAAPPDPTPPSLGRPPSRIAAAVRSVAWGAVGFALLIGLWAAAAAWKPQIPTPAATFTEMRHLLEDPFHNGLGNDKGIGVLLVDSLGRVFKGFAFAALVGVPLGLLMGASRRAWMSLNPVIQLLRPVSPLAWFPIWLTLFRDAPQAAVWTIFLTALWPIVLNTATGAASVPVDQRNVSQVFRFSRRAYVRHVLVPHSLPSIVTGLRLSMGIAWMVIVAIEMLSGGVGIGFFVWDSYNALNLAKVICAIGIIGTVGLLFDAAFLRLGKAVAQ